MQHLIVCLFLLLHVWIPRSGWNLPILGHCVLVLTRVCSQMNADRLPAAWHFFMPLPRSTFPFPTQSHIASVSIKVNVSAHTFMCLWLGRPGAFHIVQTPARARKAMERWRSRRRAQGEGRGNQSGQASDKSSWQVSQAWWNHLVPHPGLLNPGHTCCVCKTRLEL